MALSSLGEFRNINYEDFFYRWASFGVVNTDIPGGVNYYGFMNTAGQYYIMRETISGSVTTYDIYAQFAQPVGVYATDWTGRAALTYVRFDTSFFKLASS